MPDTKITVATPVGPFKEQRQWLAECIGSVAKQTYMPDEVLLIDDMAGLGKVFPGVLILDNENINYSVWRSPWRLGVAHAFNFGVALAANEWVFMLGADDTLDPDCLQECVSAIAQHKNNKLGYYYVGVHYMDNEAGDQYVPCNAAMVNKELWRVTGGFPVETAIGAPDAAFVSMSLANTDFPAQMYLVDGKRPLYNYRTHPDTDTAGRGLYQGAILQVRNILTKNWHTPRWGRVS